MGKTAIVIVLIAVTISLALAMVPGSFVGLPAELPEDVPEGPGSGPLDPAPPRGSGPGRIPGAGPGKLPPLPDSTVDPPRGEARLDARIEAIRSRPLGFVKLRVRDAASGRPVPAFRYRLYGPGTELQAKQVEGHEAEVGLRVGMPSNLRVEAEGYAPAELRQILLTEQDRFKPIEVRLQPEKRR